jgi:KDO2-lipid IV(A) lauroyltransferase
MRRFLFKFAFFYPRIYAFSCYHRKKEKRREYEDKISFLYPAEKSSESVKKIVMGIFELRGVRKIMRYLIPHMDALFIKHFVRVQGLHYLDEALKEGRGVVLMAGHLGIPHLSFNALRTMGYDLILLSGVTPKEPKHAKIRYYDTYQNTIFVNDLSSSEEYKKRIFETLRAGKIIYYDGDAGEGRIKEKVSFLGKIMEFPTGMIHLAHQAKAAIVPFIHLYEKGKITLILKETADHYWVNGEGEYRKIVEAFAKLLESYILTYPEQYLGIYGPTIPAYYYRDHRVKDERSCY